MIETYGNEVIGQYLATGRVPSHMPGLPLPSPRETWDYVTQLPFEQRAGLANVILSQNDLTSRQLARLLHSVPPNHSLSGKQVIHFVMRLLNDAQDRGVHEQLCADLLDGYDERGMTNLMGSIFATPFLEIKEKDGRWIPTEALQKALIRHINKANNAEDHDLNSDVFTLESTCFDPGVLEAYVNKIGIAKRRALLLDMHTNRCLVSEDAIEPKDKRTYLDVFIKRFGQEFMTYCLSPVLHTVVEFNPKAPITMHNLVSKLGGSQFLEMYFLLEPNRAIKVATVMVSNKQSLKEFPFLNEIVIDKWTSIFDQLARLETNLTEDALADAYANCARIVCKNAPSEAPRLLQYSLMLMGYKGEMAVNIYLEEMHRESDNTPFLSVARGMGVKRFSENVSLDADEIKMLPLIFPDSSSRELIAAFPQYSRHAISSDLGL